MNFCMSITRALLLYEYYDGSIVVLYWILTIMNGWMKNMKGLLLCYIESQIVMECLLVCYKGYNILL